MRFRSGWWLIRWTLCRLAICLESMLLRFSRHRCLCYSANTATVDVPLLPIVLLRPWYKSFYFCVTSTSAAVRINSYQSCCYYFCWCGCSSSTTFGVAVPLLHLLLLLCICYYLCFYCCCTFSAFTTYTAIKFLNSVMHNTSVVVFSSTGVAVPLLQTLLELRLFYLYWYSCCCCSLSSTAACATAYFLINVAAVVFLSHIYCCWYASFSTTAVVALAVPLLLLLLLLLLCFYYGFCLTFVTRFADSPYLHLLLLLLLLWYCYWCTSAISVALLSWCFFCYGWEPVATAIVCCYFCFWCVLDTTAVMSSVQDPAAVDAPPSC